VTTRIAVLYVQHSRVTLEAYGERPLSVGLLPLRFGKRVSAPGRERSPSTVLLAAAEGS
jgi:hypothetical protein